MFIYSCLLNDKFVITCSCLFHVIRKISMVGYCITFGLRPHVIRHPTIDIFPSYVNKQGITNIIISYHIISITCVYRRTKEEGIRCKISLKKGGHAMWAPKKKKKKTGSFLKWSPKMGDIQCAKMQFHAKICKFYVKITVKFMNFSKCVRSAKIFNLYVKFFTKVEKRGHWVWT